MLLLVAAASSYVAANTQGDKYTFRRIDSVQA